MSLIDFLYGGKKASDIPFWVLEEKMEEIHKRRKKEEEEEHRRRIEYTRDMEYRRMKEFEKAYVEEVIKRVEEKMKNEQ